MQNANCSYSTLVAIFSCTKPELETSSRRIRETLPYLKPRRFECLMRGHLTYLHLSRMDNTRLHRRRMLLCVGVDIGPGNTYSESGLHLDKNTLKQSQITGLDEIIAHAVLSDGISIF
jgi:hypothetical protein